MKKILCAAAAAFIGICAYAADTFESMASALSDVQSERVQQYKAIWADSAKKDLVSAKWESLTVQAYEALAAKEKSLIQAYISTIEPTADNCALYALSRPDVFAKKASDEVYAAYLALEGVTESNKAAVAVFRGGEGVWEIDVANISKGYAAKYVRALMAAQGSRTNQAMLEKMISLTTLFQSKGFTEGYTEANKALGTYFGAIRAIQETSK